MIIKGKCIYCNSFENLTESDTIKYALTGAKLKNDLCDRYWHHVNISFYLEAYRR